MLKPCLVCSALALSMLSLPTIAALIFPSSATAKTIAQNSSLNWQPMRDFWRRLTTVPRKRGAGRPEKFFDVISPGIWVDQGATTLLVDETLPVEVWNTQPMVIWQSNGDPAYLPDRVEVLQAGQTEPIWHKEIPSAKFVALPVETVLQPGQQYQIRFLKWNVEAKQDVAIMKPVKIQIMSNDQRNQIHQQLSDAEAKTRSFSREALPFGYATGLTRKATPLEIVHSRIGVFVKKQLWSDALQELNSANLPIAERQAIIQEVVKQWYEQQGYSDEVEKTVRDVKMYLKGIQDSPGFL